MLNDRASRVGAIFIAVALFAEYGFAQLAIQESKWDRALPDMELTNVSFDGSYMTLAWQNMSSRLGLRTILFRGYENPDSEGSSKQSFSYTAREATAHEVLDSFSSHYGYQWAHDEATGVIWIFPESYKYENILSARIEVSRDMRSVPMVTGIFVALRDDERLGVGLSFPRSIETYNYSVNVPTGIYTVRDMLNIACVANPAFHFVILEDEYLGIYTQDVVYPVLLTSYNYRFLTQGVSWFWQIELTTPGESAPTIEVLMEKLSDSDSLTRKKARQYTGGTTWTYTTIGKLIESSAHPSEDRERDLWVATYFLYSYIKVDYRTIPKEIRQLLENSLTEEFIRTGSPQIVLLAGLVQLAYSGGWNLETPVQDLMAARRFTALELQGIEDDVAHIALRSESVFRALIDKKYNGYIDTSGWAQGFLGSSYEESRTLQFTNPDAARPFESPGSKWLLRGVIAILVGMPILTAVVLRRKSRQT